VLSITLRLATVGKSDRLPLKVACGRKSRFPKFGILSDRVIDGFSRNPQRVNIQFSVDLVEAVYLSPVMRRARTNPTFPGINM